ncbi:MAG: hypothetical protein ACFFCW_26850 [Candidatus Hodarchaeota archaeon]
MTITPSIPFLFLRKKLICLTLGALLLLFVGSAHSTSSFLPTGPQCDTSGMAPYLSVTGVGHLGDGAGAAIVDINGNGTPDVVFMAYDAPSGANNFRYKIGWDINLQTGNVSGISTWISVLGVGDLGQGAGVALADIDRNGRLDMVFMAYDNPAGENTFRYRIGWNLNNGGIPARLDQNYTEVNGVGPEGSGAGVALADIDQNGDLDMVLMAYDSRPDWNEFRYRIGWNIDNTGATTNWSPIRTVDGVGTLAQGADLVITDIDLDGNLDMVFMAYDNPLWNNFRYKIGWRLQNNGLATNWSRWFMLKGVGQEGDGAGLAVAYHYQTGLVLFFMGYDDPAGANDFRYFIRRLTTSGATYGIADDHPPAANNALRVPTQSTGQTGTRLFNLNMQEVQQTASDAYALYIFYCMFVGLGGNTADHPACWHDYPNDDTNIVTVFANSKFETENGPDLMAAAIALYVDAYMGWTPDEINGYVMNTIHNLNYYYGGDAIPAYYTIHYSDPGKHPNLINQLQNVDPGWAAEYNDGMVYHGDCEDFAILRHALLRALGFDRDYIWNAQVPGHEFNVVLYKGSYRIMDYGHIYHYFCNPGGKKEIKMVWNQRHGPRSYNAGSQYLRDYILGHIYPDRCDTGYGWLFMQIVHPDLHNNSRCP